MKICAVQMYLSFALHLFMEFSCFSGAQFYLGIHAQA